MIKLTLDNIFRVSTVLALVSTTAMAIPGDITDCTIDHGICVCTGDCPSFTSNWPENNKVDALCIAVENVNATVDIMDLRDGGMNGEVDIDGKEYTAPFAHCPSSESSDGDEEEEDGGGGGGNDGINGSRSISSMYYCFVASAAAVMIGADVWENE